MFETIVSTDRALARHRDGPLAEQRSRYLLQCADQGGTRESLRLRARSILWVAEHMSPNDFGKVDASRLHEIIYGSVSLAIPAQTTAATLVSYARPWLKYLGWWPQVEYSIPFAPALDHFVAWMRDERGLTQCTIDQWKYRTSKFLHWCSDTGRDLATLRPHDIDVYFVTYAAQRWSRISAGHIANMLRVFFRHTASTGGCSAALASSIQGNRRVESMQTKRISPHTLRHTTAVHLLRAGVDINTIRAWLGHVSLDTTQVYAEVDLEMKAKALASVDITDLPVARGRPPGTSATIMNFMKQL